VNAVTELADHLRCHQIEVVTLESTGGNRQKEDAVWLAKLTERGMLRPSFVPPPEIRRLREFTRLRADLVHERTRYWARLEKLLERALIKISAVASSLDTDSTRAMIEALIAGQRNPKALADLAIGRMRPKRARLAEALDGKFEPHHGELARILLDQIDALTAQIDVLTARVTELIEQIPAAQGIDADGTTGPGAGTGPGAPVLPAVARLDEITGCGIIAAQAVLAGIGLDMTVFGTPGRLVSRAKRCPQTRQSGTKTSTGKAARATGTSTASSARSPPPPAGPTPSSASATAAWPAAAASARPWPPWPARSWSSSSICSPTPKPGSTTSDRTSTTIASAGNARSATTSASSRPSA